MNLLATRRGQQVLFGALYLSEGAPIGFIWWALPTRLRVAGVGVETITALTSMLVLPWVFKFLWSPLIDAVRTPRWTLRSWILSMQLLMGISLVPLVIEDVSVNLSWMFPLLLVHACAAATQDAAIDALAIASVPPAERGAINGWMQVGMLTGRSTLGGGALMLEQQIGTCGVMVALIGVIWSSSLLVLASREIGPPQVTAESIIDRFRRLGSRLRSASRSPVTWAGLLFAATAGAGFEAVGAVAGPFLIDRGSTSEEVGAFFALNSVMGMAAGAIVGGYLADRLGKRAAVSTFLVLMTVCILGLAALDYDSGKQAGAWLIPAMTVLYVCIGLFTASSYALFMEITDPALGATQFSAFMGATNGCESWSAFAVGKVIPLMGYPAAFSLLGLVSLGALPLVRYLTWLPRKNASG